MQDVVKRDIAAAAPEGAHTKRQLIHQDAQRPPVNLAAVARAIYDLGGEVFLQGVV